MAPIPSLEPAPLPERLSHALTTLADTLHSLRTLLASAPSSPPTSHPPARLSLRDVPALLKRQAIVAIPATYATQNNSPEPGVVAGITIGSVAGLLLVLWLLYTCFNLGGGPAATATVVDDVEVVRRRSRSPARRPARRRSVSETVEVRRQQPRSRTPPPPRNRRETVTIIEESRRRGSPAPAPPPVVVEEGEDIVEVIEEHSPPPRRNRRVSSGYRTVDPEEFGGGDRHRRSVRR